MIIRPILDSDLPAVLEVYRQSEDFLALGPDPHASPEMVAKDRELSRLEGGVYCGIFLEGAPKNLTGSITNLSGSVSGEDLPTNLTGFENPSGLVPRESAAKNLTGSVSGEDLPTNLTGFENLSGLVPRESAAKNLTGSTTNLSGSGNGENLPASEILAGILDYTPNYHGDPGAVFIELLMIAAPYRGRGLGKAAVDWLISRLGGETGQRRLYAAVQTNNPAAIRFWQRQGFRIAGPAALQSDGTVTYPFERET